MNNYLVVLQSEGETEYPEVHYVFEDDEFHPEADAADQTEGDISVIVDIDFVSGRVTDCRSLSPAWQPVECTLRPQMLGANNQQGALICIDGVRAKQNTDIASLRGTPLTQASTALELATELEEHRRKVRASLLKDGPLDGLK